MSAKILAFDPNHRVPPRYYTPIAMRGRLLHMPSPAAKGTSNSAPQEGLKWWEPTAIQCRGQIAGSRVCNAYWATLDESSPLPAMPQLPDATGNSYILPPAGTSWRTVCEALSSDNDRRGAKNAQTQ
jgi:hypothetical protein